MRKKKKETSIEGLIAELDPVQTEIITPCSSWCFLFGVGFQGTCSLSKGHDGEHRVVIELVQEPRSIFTVYWTLLDS